MKVRCERLWESTNDKLAEDNGANQKSQQPHYWEHEVAVVESCPERICLLMGILSFVNGVWELRNLQGSIVCAAADRDCHQYRDRCVFATKWTVHRETFTDADKNQFKKVYISIDSFHAACLPTNDDGSISSITRNPSQREVGSSNSVRFLVLGKSMPQLIYSSLPSTRYIFGYLAVVSLYAQSTRHQPLAKRRKSDVFTSSARSATQEQADGGPTRCIFCFDQNHKSLTYPELMEGRVYQMELDSSQLMKHP